MGAFSPQISEPLVRDPERASKGERTVSISVAVFEIIDL